MGDPRPATRYSKIDCLTTKKLHPRQYLAPCLAKKRGRNCSRKVTLTDFGHWQKSAERVFEGRNRHHRPSARGQVVQQMPSL